MRGRRTPADARHMIDPRARAVTDPRARAVADTRERFLREITAKIPADRIAELHLFRPMVRGGTETGVAVIAADFIGPPVEPAGRADDLPAGRLDDPAADGVDDQTAHEPTPPQRHTVLTARYRLALKGAERGKWEFDVVADADAPLVTVDSVVRGVQRRAGDDDEPERVSADALRAAIDGPPCTETR